MGRKLNGSNPTGGSTDHSEEVCELRRVAQSKERYDALVYRTAADLLEAHDESGISLDNWTNARDLVELLIGHEIVESNI